MNGKMTDFKRARLSVKPREFIDQAMKEGLTREQAKEAYRKLAVKHHPDNGGDAEAFMRAADPGVALAALFR